MPAAERIAACDKRRHCGWNGRRRRSSTFFGVPYADLAYRPMLELFEYLKANGFRVFVCSGGGRDFMRVFTEGTWASSRTEGVIGSSADYEYVDGKIVRQDRMLGALALGPGKPAHIYAHTGRLPLFAGGNADVDMLESATFAVLINHDDRHREYAQHRRRRKIPQPPQTSPAG